MATSLTATLGSLPVSAVPRSCRAEVGKLNLHVGSRGTSWPASVHFITKEPHACSLKETIGHAGIIPGKRNVFEVSVPEEDVQTMVVEYERGEPWTLQKACLAKSSTFHLFMDAPMGINISANQTLQLPDLLANKDRGNGGVAIGRSDYTDALNAFIVYVADGSFLATLALLEVHCKLDTSAETFEFLARCDEIGLRGDALHYAYEIMARADVNRFVKLVKEKDIVLKDILS